MHGRLVEKNYERLKFAKFPTSSPVFSQTNQLSGHFPTNSGHYSVPTWYESLLHIPNYILAFESLDLDLYRAWNGLLKLEEKFGKFLDFRRWHVGGVEAAMVGVWSTHASAKGFAFRRRGW
ncbi:hypothetical protein DVH24_005083 [Malus domestica]|uniref:Uncharacterized protein n=1 Tax=Malus domestica TaxID=3750 RepID=A0A498IDR3_MALDO|nr:hypothetical protein DVH24_005083 [Malus domestica]